MVKFDATFDSYTKTPPMIILKEGEPVVEKKAPVHRPVVQRLITRINGSRSASWSFKH